MRFDPFQELLTPDSCSNFGDSFSNLSADDLARIVEACPEPPDSVYWINVNSTADVDRWVSELGVRCLSSPRVVFIAPSHLKQEIAAHIRTLTAEAS